MKLLTFESRANPNSGLRLGLVWPAGPIIDLAAAASSLGLRTLPTKMLDYLDGGALTRDTVEEVVSRTDDFGSQAVDFVVSPQQVNLRAPLPVPRSLRTFCVFEDHLRALESWLGQDFHERWRQSPGFRFSNHQSLRGTGEAVPMPRAGKALDFEVGLACVVGRAGVNISAAEATDYIAGLTLCVGWVLRDQQRLESIGGFGHAKSHDFATSLGPYLVTLDELDNQRDGDHFRIEMAAALNGEAFLRTDFGAAHWTFTQMIEVASQDAPLFPGDVLASGPVAGGTLLEARAGGSWLGPGDLLEVEAEQLGTLSSTVE